MAADGYGFWAGVVNIIKLMTVMATQVINILKTTGFYTYLDKLHAVLIIFQYNLKIEMSYLYFDISLNFLYLDYISEFLAPTLQYNHHIFNFNCI